MRGIIERYCSNFTETILSMCSSPRTLTHSDYRLTNMLFGGPPDAREITVVDWQRVAIARGPIDVAFFAVLSLTTELRRAWERELVEQYHDALMAEGVKGYSLEECWRDYRLCAIGPSRITLSFSARPRDDMGGGHLLALQQTLISARGGGDGRPGDGGVCVGDPSWLPGLPPTRAMRSAAPPAGFPLPGRPAARRGTPSRQPCR